MKISVNFYDIKQCIADRDIAYKELTEAVAAETDVLIKINCSCMKWKSKKKAHIKRKGFNDQIAKDELTNVIFRHKLASCNHQSKVSELKECIRQYAGVPSYAYKVKVNISKDQSYADIIFNLLPDDINEGHYRVNLSNGNITHIREYGSRTDGGVNLLARKMSRMNARG